MTEHVTCVTMVRRHLRHCGQRLLRQTLGFVMQCRSRKYLHQQIRFHDTRYFKDS